MITLHGTPHYLLKRKFTPNLSKSQPYSRKKARGLRDRRAFSADSGRR